MWYNERISTNADFLKNAVPVYRQAAFFKSLCESNEHGETEGFDVSAYAG